MVTAELPPLMGPGAGGGDSMGWLRDQTVALPHPGSGGQFPWRVDMWTPAQGPVVCQLHMVPGGHPQQDPSHTEHFSYMRPAERGPSVPRAR